MWGLMRGRYSVRHADQGTKCIILWRTDRLCPHTTCRRPREHAYDIDDDDDDDGGVKVVNVTCVSDVAIIVA